MFCKQQANGRKQREMFCRKKRHVVQMKGGAQRSDEQMRQKEMFCEQQVYGREARRWSVRNSNCFASNKCMGGRHRDGPCATAIVVWEGGAEMVRAKQHCLRATSVWEGGTEMVRAQQQMWCGREARRWSVQNSKCFASNECMGGRHRDGPCATAIVV
eukprot:1159499-Pelagomonas_calceolata.AAC.5